MSEPTPVSPVSAAASRSPDPETAGERAAEIETLLAAWERKLESALEKLDRSVVIGRELVEQRALNLDLQRQLHRLEEEVRMLREGKEAADRQTETCGTLTEIGKTGASSGGRGKDGKRSLLQKLLR